MKKEKKIFIGIIFFALMAGGFYWYENTKVQITDVLVGIGKEARAGQTAVFDYRAFLYDPNAPQTFGKQVDSTYERKTQMKVVIGQGQVIPGLDIALVGMKAGGQRQALIAPSKAYGDKGAGDGVIPPGAKLVYLIELRALEL